MGIREDNQTPDTGGRASYLKREGKLVNFKIRQEMTRQDMKQNLNRDKDRVPPRQQQAMGGVPGTTEHQERNLCCMSIPEGLNPEMIWIVEESLIHTSGDLVHRGCFAWGR